MAAAEFPVYLLHLLPVLIRELQKVEPGDSNMTGLITPETKVYPWTPANLLEQDVSYSLDEVVPVALRLGRAVSPFLHGGKEGVVKEEQLVQTGEDSLHRFGVQLHFLSHASPENLGHDVQSLQVMKLGLHQLWIRVGEVLDLGHVLNYANKKLNLLLSLKTVFCGLTLLHMKSWHMQKVKHSRRRLSQQQHLLTIDYILPLDSSFVLLLAELVLNRQAPWFSFIFHRISWYVTVDVWVCAVCRWKEAYESL